MLLISNWISLFGSICNIKWKYSNIFKLFADNSAYAPSKSYGIGRLDGPRNRTSCKQPVNFLLKYYCIRRIPSLIWRWCLFRVVFTNNFAPKDRLFWWYFYAPVLFAEPCQLTLTNNSCCQLSSDSLAIYVASVATAFRFTFKPPKFELMCYLVRANFF